MNYFLPLDNKSTVINVFILTVYCSRECDSIILCEKNEQIPKTTYLV